MLPSIPTSIESLAAGYLAMRGESQSPQAEDDLVLYPNPHPTPYSERPDIREPDIPSVYHGRTFDVEIPETRSVNPSEERFSDDASTLVTNNWRDEASSDTGSLVTNNSFTQELTYGLLNCCRWTPIARPENPSPPSSPSTYIDDSPASYSQDLASLPPDTQNQSRGEEETHSPLPHSSGIQTPSSPPPPYEEVTSALQFPTAQSLSPLLDLYSPSPLPNWIQCNERHIRGGYVTPESPAGMFSPRPDRGYHLQTHLSSIPASNRLYRIAEEAELEALNRMDGLSWHTQADDLPSGAEQDQSDQFSDRINLPMLPSVDNNVAVREATQDLQSGTIFSQSFADMVQHLNAFERYYGERQERMGDPILEIELQRLQQTYAHLLAENRALNAEHDVLLQRNRDMDTLLSLVGNNEGRSDEDRLRNRIVELEQQLQLISTDRELLRSSNYQYRATNIELLESLRALSDLARSVRTFVLEAEEEGLY